MNLEGAAAERVLVLAPTERDTRLTLELLAQGGFAAHACAGIEQLIDELARGAGALLLTDDVETLPGVGRLATVLTQQPEWSEIPVLVLAHPTRETDCLPNLGETPGVTLLERPVRVRTLVSALRMALRARRRQYQLRRQLEAERRLQLRLATELAAMHRLHALATALSRPQSIEPQLAHVLETATELSGADAVLLAVDLESAPTHSRIATRGIAPDAGLPGASLQALVSGHAQAIWVDGSDAGQDAELRGWLAGAGFHGLLAVPLRSTAGRSLGTLGLLWQRASRSPDVQLPIELLARLTAGSLERTQHDEERREADRRKDEFLAMLAHELRNPLAPIRQAVRASRAARVTPAQLQWSHDVIDRQVRHMARLLDDLLDLSRITRGRLQLRCERILLRSAVEAAIETSTPAIESRRHALSVAIPEEPVWVDADPVRLAQVLSNLLNNAAKYTDPGGRIALEVEARPGDVVVRVRDNGIGLEVASLQRVFDMFAQVDAAHERSQGGLGIGLALVKGVVELHGGEVSVASEGPGRGSAFAITVPRAAGPDASAAARGERRAFAGPSRRIVIADDNVDAAESLALVLRLSGHDVQIVHDGLAAVEAVERWHPDVAILDIGMPKLDGYSAARQIRARQNGHSPTLVAVTGWGQDEDRRRSRDAGFDEHFTKPVDPDSLLGLVTTH